MKTSRRTWIAALVAVAAALTLGALTGSGGAAAEPRPRLASKVAADRPAAKPQDITFDTLKLELKKGDPFKKEHLTDKVKKIDGKTVRVRGWIFPSFQQSGITEFVLVRDNLECCFGPGAALHDCIRVVMEKGKSTEYVYRVVTVEGKFSVREFTGPAGEQLAIYHMDGKSVE